jgi:hypothetical protein
MHRTITTSHEHRTRYLDSAAIPTLKIQSYAELQELIHVSLRIQHPEWIESNGDSPICDSYEVRFAELVGLTHPRKNVTANS